MYVILEQGLKYYGLDYIGWIVLSLSNLVIEIIDMYYWDIKSETVASVRLLDVWACIG